MTQGRVQKSGGLTPLISLVLIVALGIMSDPIDGVVIMVSVVILYVHQEKIVYPLAVKFGFEPEDPRPKADDG
ncbi:MAG: hypothetical protein IH933_17150 [Euryarchaeota archaeon]|nr:hypothetical protein [Euryarchaeota archaeon]